MFNKEEIKQIAEECGIPMIGIVEAKSAHYLLPMLLEREEKGFMTDMESKNYISRTEAKQIMPSVKSVIAVGLPYMVNFHPIRYPYTGILSRSSWGLDYHFVIRERLQKLADRLKNFKKFSYHIQVDNGPLIEREWAYLSGLGFLGKNHCLIHPDYGSFVFLGLMLTDFNVDEYDGCIDQHCGSCQICKSACPTGALSTNGYNSNRCISYITQSKLHLSQNQRFQMGNHIYGCDICQEACPYNKQIRHSGDPIFQPELTGGSVDLEQFILLDKKVFEEKFSRMSGAWRGMNVLKRNAIINLVNLGYPNKSIFKKLCHSNSPILKEYSLWAINMGSDLQFVIK